MKQAMKKHGSLIIWLITAIAIVVSSYFLKETKYENTWLWILLVGTILASAFDLLFKKDKE